MVWAAPAGREPAPAITSLGPPGLTGAGGGNGGYGGSSLFGAAGGNAYGSLTAPSDLGSGGGNTTGTTPYNLGGAGGGALRLTVNGTFALDGRLSADGLPAVGPASGGGSGGSLYLTAGILTGAGTISAAAVRAIRPMAVAAAGAASRSIMAPTSSVEGFSPCGGSGAVIGGAGTVYMAPNKGQNTLPQAHCGQWRAARNQHAAVGSRAGSIWASAAGRW